MQREQSRQDGHAGADRHHRPKLLKVLIAEPHTPLGHHRTKGGRIMGAMDSNTCPLSGLQSDEPRSVRPSDLPLSVAKIMNPVGGSLDLRNGECSLGRSPISPSLFVSRVLADGHAEYAQRGISSENRQGVVALSYDDLYLRLLNNGSHRYEHAQP